MKNRESFLFSIILLLINTVGVAGALLTSLEIDFETVLQPALFFCGMLFICLLSGVLWSTRSTRSKTVKALQWGLLIAFSIVCALLFWRNLSEGLGWALQRMLERINERYGIHLIWNLAQEADLAKPGMESVMTQATWSVLAVMFPLVLLLGYAVVRKRAVALLPANAVWFMAACTMDDFPAYVWLVLCILGFAAVVIRGAFRDDERAGIQAVLIWTAALGVVMALVYRFAVPFIDSRYDATQEERIELNRKINEEWIPEIKRILSGFGSGTDVTGSLNRKTGTAYTSEEIYRVTFSAAPKSTVYLRGFVGKDYAGNEWKPGRDSDLEKYYRREGWQLPEDGSDLVNLTYDAFSSQVSETVWVEELANSGSYTVYPYGTQLTEDYQVHWDGTVERKGSSWKFTYSPPEDYRLEKEPADKAAKEEVKYRDYVYDTFCEYPAEDFPELTEFLENAGFRTGSVYESLEDVLAYLTGNAVYNLDVPNTPRGKDFVEYFLFESREGYCAHFASSAVLILRYLGIPARYATGYAASSGDFMRNTDGNYSAVVLNKQAHAWAEVYLDGIGWVPVEMTPGAVPFPRDNTVEQLALTAQLTAEGSGGGVFPAELNPPIGNESSADRDEPDQKETSGDEDSGQDSAVDQAESDGQTGTGSQVSDAIQAGTSGQAGSGSQGSSGQAGTGGQGNGTGQAGSSGQAGTGSQGSGTVQVGTGSQGIGSVQVGTGSQGSGGDQGSSGGPAGSGGTVGKDSSGQGGLGGPVSSGADEDYKMIRMREIFAGVLAVLRPILLAVGLLLLLVVLWKQMWTLIRRSSRGKLERADSREKVFLLHRNMRRLLAVSGCAERINCSDENTAEFNRLLEQCGFGEKAPAPEELQAARIFCETVAKEVYTTLPFYKKPLFLGLNVYGLGR